MHVVGTDLGRNVMVSASQDSGHYPILTHILRYHSIITGYIPVYEPACSAIP
jgi:hypothetical protein